MSHFEPDTEDREFALLLKRQQQLEHTPDMTEGILDLQRIVTMLNDDIDIDDEDDGGDDEARGVAIGGSVSEPTTATTTRCVGITTTTHADSRVDMAGMSITCDRHHLKQSSGDTTSLDETIADEYGADDTTATGNGRPRRTFVTQPTTRSAFALFWEGGLMYTVCMILPAVFHWLFYDDSGNLWVKVAYLSTRNAVLESLRQVGLRVEYVVCARVDCAEWKSYVRETVDPVIEYVCTTDNVEHPYSDRDTASHELGVRHYLSAVYWSHYLGICPVLEPIIEVEEIIPLLPIVSPDITGWEHDVHIILAMSMGLIMARQILGLIFGPLSTDSQSPLLMHTNAKTISTEPLPLRVVVQNESEPVFTSTDDEFAPIAVSATEETDRVVNITPLHRLEPRERGNDQTSVSARSVKSSRSIRSMRSFRSGLSSTSRRVKRFRQRLFGNKAGRNRSSADSISSARSQGVDLSEHTVENDSGKRPPPPPQLKQQYKENPLWQELQNASTQMMHRNQPNTVFTEYEEHQQQHVWVGSVQAGGAMDRAQSSPTASLDSSISSKHDTPTSIRKNQPNEDFSDSRNIMPSYYTEVELSSFDVTELFQFLCCIVAVLQAWFSFRDSNFWPWYVGGHGNTSNCWDLSGGPSVGMDGGFDHLNAVLKRYFLGQASYHLFSVALQVQRITHSHWHQQTSSRKETAKHPVVSLIQHMLVLVVFSVAFVFPSLRRLVAVGVFAFDVSKLCWHLCQTLASNKEMEIVTRGIHFCLVVPSFVMARFVIWPVLWYSATYESVDWLTQLEQTLWPGSVETFRISCHVWLILLLLVSVIDFRCIIRSTGTERLHDKSKMRSRDMAPEQTNT